MSFGLELITQDGRTNILDINSYQVLDYVEAPLNVDGSISHPNWVAGEDSYVYLFANSIYGFGSVTASGNTLSWTKNTAAAAASFSAGIALIKGQLEIV